jgi:hypothetical protein
VSEPVHLMVARKQRARKTGRGQCCSTLKLRYGALRQFSRKQDFIVLAQTPVQRLSPENKGVLHFIPL